MRFFGNFIFARMFYENHLTTSFRIYIYGFEYGVGNALDDHKHRTIFVLVKKSFRNA